MDGTLKWNDVNNLITSKYSSSQLCTHKGGEQAIFFVHTCINSFTSRAAAGGSCNLITGNVIQLHE